jgi:hypothetical protein
MMAKDVNVLDNVDRHVIVCDDILAAWELSFICREPGRVLRDLPKKNADIDTQLFARVIIQILGEKRWQFRAEDKGTGTGAINKWVGIGELEDMYNRGRGGSFIPHLVSASYRAVLTQAKSRVILPSTPDQHPRQ